MKRLITLCLLGGCFLSAPAQNYVSQAWVADQGNGTYKNPVLYADYSDPDVCRVGDDYYLTSSSFNCLPGLQILHSKDLVNWTIIGAAVPYALPPVTDVRPEHGNRVWAPSIRHHNGEFYIFWGDPDQGAFMVKAKDPKGPWSEPVLVKAGKGIIDTTPLWDDDGRVYLVHAYAGSRAGLKSVITICELSADASKAITQSRIIFDGHEAHQTCEGPKFYKRNGYYYIFHPAGGVPTGWQVVLRSKNVYGPYEWKTVLAQGNSPVNGPHQGGWVDTPTGEDWFMHFQDVGAYGRLVHLQPMKWVDDWPVIGIDKDGDGCGEPVLTYKKPNVGKNYPICTPQESDEFDGYTLSPQWQWQANINEKWAYFNGGEGFVRLYSYPVPEDYKSLWDVSNLMLQKTPAPNFTATTKLTPAQEVPRINMVWESIPSQLAKENKKFLFGAMRKGARASQFEMAIQWLKDAGLIYQVNRVSAPGMPLKFYSDMAVFKLFVLDIGLMGAMVDAPAESILVADTLFREYKGAFTELFVLTQLMPLGLPIYYFSSNDSRVEIDLIVQHGNIITPIEVKAEENVHAKSLRTFISKHPQLKGLRLSMKPYQDQEWMTNKPLYAVGAWLK